MTNVFLPPQSQPQHNREYLFDDPYAPLRLPPLAQISEFWRRYDRLADIHDKKLTSNLNGNLDVLLIFAALFSAINTTFISITMPDLSPSASDETNTLLRLLVMKADNNTLTPTDLAPTFYVSSNSIIVNGLLYASLSCSLLAAVGAMMAKEWLQSFDRTGQTGPLEEQARFRQRKFNGVLEWHLEAVIKFLPNLLLFSVIFFFVGVCLFLFPINTVVAGIVIAFSGIGVVFSGIVIVAGAISPTCPYQSAASSALRRCSLGLVQPWRLVWQKIIRPAHRKTLALVRKFWTKTHLWIHSLPDSAASVVSRVRSWYHVHRSSRSNRSGAQQVIDQDPTPSVRVGSESSSPIHPSSFRSFSFTIRSGDDGSSSGAPTGGRVGYFPIVISQAVARVKRDFKRLPGMGFLSSFRDGSSVNAMKPNREQVLTVQAARWLLATTSSRGDQISTAQLICSLDKATCANIFEDYNSWKRLFNLTLGAFEIWDSQPNKENQEVVELFGLVLCRTLLQCPKEDAKWNDITENSLQGSNEFVKAFLHTLAPASTRYSPDDPEDDHRILYICFMFTALAHRTNLKEFQWASPSRLLDGDTPAAAALLSVWTLLVWGVSAAQSGASVVMGFHFTGFLEDQEELAKNLSGALCESPQCFQLVQGDLESERHAAQGYTVCLQTARQLSPKPVFLEWEGLDGLGQLIWSYIDQLATSGSTEIRLVKLSVEALLTLRTFLSSKPSSSGTPRTWRNGLISSAALIDTVVDVLIDDLTSLTSQNVTWKSKGRTFKACIIRMLLWIWRNHRNRNPSDQKRREFFASSCRLWAPLEKEVSFSKTGSFGDEDKPLTPDDLKGVAEFAQWVQTQTLDRHSTEDYEDYKLIQMSNFIVLGADVGINRLYAHFDRHAAWDYHLHGFPREVALCSRSAYTEDGMP
ncbi:hypothetical protein FRC01_002800, partial [Tulasnella sp. 417]